MSQDWLNIFYSGAIILNSLTIIMLSFKIRNAQSLISAETKRKQAHTKVFEDASNPDLIEAEMNRNADFMEARNTGRLTAPRPDAGPPAIIHTPNLRSVQPRSGRSRQFQEIWQDMPVDTSKKDD